MAQFFGAQSNRKLRIKNSRDDALERQEQFIEKWRVYLVDDEAWTSTGLARKIKKKIPDDQRHEKTIKNFVQKIRKRMRAEAMLAASHKLTR